MQPFQIGGRRVPVRALVLSVGALLVPVVGTFALPGRRSDVEDALLWLIALIPAFLLAYYRGWRGVATALAAGMAVLSLTYAAVTLLERDVPRVIFPIVVAYLAIGLGIGVFAEVLHRQRTAAEDLALTDELTKLANRRHAQLFLDHEFAIAQRGRPLTVVLFDLDGFKAYNDQYGHAAGDEGLAAFGEILSRHTRRMNISARFGGEEFLSILTGSDEHGALVFAERVRETLAAKTLSHGQVTVSAGIASYVPVMDSPEALISAADTALYRAKADGRNCVRTAGGLAEMGNGAGTSGALHSPLTKDAPSNVLELSGDGVDPSRIASTTKGPFQITRFGEGRRVLLVEDDEPVRSMMASYLRKEGFSVIETGDVTSGLRAMGREFDIVVTDIRLPGPSGNELVAALKARWPETQAVVVTGFRDAGVAVEALNAGADRYLFKPFGLPEFQAHLQDALARRDRTLHDRDERHRLAEEASRRGGEAREAVLRGARALVRAVEVRDPYTQGHSRRVAEYAVAIVESLGPRAADIDPDRLFLACELHDLGKIGIPDAILNKEGPLTSEEFEEVRKHPETGQKILEPLFGDELILAVTRWHHERWDGTGYPDGLAGEAIPEVARIVAFADTLDAMTSTRAYRSRLSWDQAIHHILDQGGSQFDPDMIEPFRSAVPGLSEAFLSSENYDD